MGIFPTWLRQNMGDAEDFWKGVRGHFYGADLRTYRYAGYGTGTHRHNRYPLRLLVFSPQVLWTPHAVQNYSFRCEIKLSWTKLRPLPRERANIKTPIRPILGSRSKTEHAHKRKLEGCSVAHVRHPPSRNDTRTPGENTHGDYRYRLTVTLCAQLETLMLGGMLSAVGPLGDT